MLKYFNRLLVFTYIIFLTSLSAHAQAKPNTPDVTLNLIGKHGTTANIKVVGRDPILKACLKSGAKLTYLYQMQICKRRPLWFDSCQTKRKLMKTAQFDSISRNYEMHTSWDTLSDTDQNVADQKQTFSEQVELLSELRSHKNLALSFLAFNLSEYVNSQRSYVAIRVTSGCVGETSQAVDQLSQVLSFGLNQLAGFDTGWIDFHLRAVE